MWLIGGNRLAGIAQSVAAIEPAFGGDIRALVIGELEAGRTAPIMRAADLDAAFGELPHALLEAIASSGYAAWGMGALSWRRRTAQVLQLLQDAGSDVAIVRLLQLLFSLDLSRGAGFSTLDLSSLTLPGHLILRNVSIAGDVYLEGLSVMGALDARGTQVARGIAAEQSRFLGPVWLAGSHLKKTARFGYSQFQSDFDAGGARFGGGIWLRHASVEGDANFNECVFEGDSSFGACRYGGAATFESATFQDTVSFEGATFQSSVALNRAVFSGRLFLRDVSFKAGIAHEGARFLGEVVPPLHEVALVSNGVDEVQSKIRNAFNSKQF